jgi:virulence-associated protein VapD
MALPGFEAGAASIAWFYVCIRNAKQFRICAQAFGACERLLQ